MKVRVVPRARKFGVTLKNAGVVARLMRPAAEGKANEELLERLRQIVGARPFLVRGAKSRDKEIAFEGVSDEEALKKISASAQGV
ncbi:MAG: DUF167 family protein [Candidatus Micrarchaeota archaeon]